MLLGFKPINVSTTESRHMGDYYNNLTVYDRVIEEPKLCNGFDETQPMLDIREAAKKNKENGIIGDSGAEAFFCDTTECAKKKDEFLTLCGMENHDDLIEEHISGLCSTYRGMWDSVLSQQERIAKQEKLLQALAFKLNYEHISFSSEGVVMVKNGITYHYPQKKRHACGWDS
jgi:hypothetical protein